LQLLREKIAIINRKIYWQAREKFFVGLPEKKPSLSATWHKFLQESKVDVNFYYIPLFYPYYYADMMLRLT